MTLKEYQELSIKNNTKVGHFIPFQSSKCEKYLPWNYYHYGYASLEIALKLTIQCKGKAIYQVCKDRRYKSNKKYKLIWVNK
jgi:hypothetical protein